MESESQITESPKTERLDARKPEDITRAAALLRAGATVAFPTETVYGLGANALDPNAVAKIFEAKQRPSWDPLIVHISDQKMISQVANVSADLAGRVKVLMLKFWPGPLTLLLPRTEQIPDVVTSGRPLVAVRMPANKVAQTLIQQTGLPIAAPSANRFGHTSPTTADHVIADLDGRIDAVLAGSNSRVGLESTVIDPTVWPMMIYRLGAVTPEMLRIPFGHDSVEVFEPPLLATQPESLPSPGVGLRHYAPNARLVLVPIPAHRADPYELLIPAIQRFSQSEKVGVLLPTGWERGDAPYFKTWGHWESRDELARKLFAGLRSLDDMGATLIVCPVPPGPGISAAIRDRLQKAAKPS